LSEDKAALLLNDRLFYAALSGVTALAFILRAYALNDQPPFEYEVQMVHGAYNYAEHGLMPRVMWWHPPLRNILMFLSMEWLGYGAYGLRFWSLILGTATVPLLGMLVLEVTGNKRTSLIASFLLAADLLHITFSRQAIQEAHIAFFTVAGVYLAVRHAKKGSQISLVLAGLAFGLGIASKWQSGFVLVVCWLMLIFPRMLGDSAIAGQPPAARIYSALSSLVLLPAAVYALSYLPWILRGYGPEEWLFLQEAMFRYTATTTHDIVSNPGRAMDWFIRLSGYASIVVSDRPYLTVGINNLIVWWLVLPSFAYLAYRSAKGAVNHGVFFSMLFWFSYIPLAFMPTRPIYLLSATAVIPFAFIGVAWAVTEAMDRLGMETGWLIGYLVAVFGSAIVLYPLVCGRAFDYPYLQFIINRFRPY